MPPSSRSVRPFRGKHNPPWRRLGEAALDSALCGGVFARICRRIGLQGRLGVTEYDVQVAASRRLDRPLTIAFASDFHAGPATDPSVYSDLMAALTATRPDVLLLGGDFVSYRATYVAALTAGIARCEAPFGKFAVLGNHDLWTDDQYLTGELEAAGVDVLVNRNVPLAAPFDGVSVCGLDDPWTGDADAVRTFAHAGPLRILLTHSPDGLLHAGDEDFDVAFAGHTHGGQIALRDGTPIVVPHGPMSRTHHHGRFNRRVGGPLIVSRGIGCSTLPVRWNADPELVLCRLL